VNLRLEIPISKHQILNNFQLTNIKYFKTVLPVVARSFLRSPIGTLRFVWDLDIGIWNLKRQISNMVG
jgi:hypothetical protein